MDVVALNVGEGERLSKEIVLRDFVRFSWRATRGLKDVAESEGRELVTRLVGVGGLSPEQGERVMSTLAARMNESRRVFETRVESSVRAAAEKMVAISKRELERIGDQAVELERRVNRLRMSRGGK